MPKDSSIIPVERIHKSILIMRGHKVILDRDLADLYEVETKILTRAIRRNIDRFPEDFMFRLTKEEFENLRRHFGTSSWGGRRYLPYAFTEQGVAMLSSVLRSKRAIEVNIAIMRTFVKLREILATNTALRRKIESMERQYEEQFKLIFKILSEMVMSDSKPKPQIGFHTEAKERSLKGKTQGKKYKVIRKK
ncbi:MAG: ORF6N domain-containing protein [Sedimentisphaerales bacterium]|nr:ORF6N domain-containing protein [Sedimentisphaerales bacterium]